MPTDAVTVRPLSSEDRAAWQLLWEGYLRFYRTTLDVAVTEATFARLVEQRGGLAGLVAVDAAGRLLGFAHVVEHGDTWSAAPALYLEDLFVDPTLRGGGIGRHLIEAVYAEADARGCSKTYWITEEFNTEARRIYETVATRQSIVMYER
jgi:GNAT superfamily N-acetyltransferase